MMFRGKRGKGTSALEFTRFKKNTTKCQNNKIPKIKIK